MNETENHFREFEEFDGFSDIDENNLIFEFLMVLYKKKN
mgnify:CR=1 FL=1